MITARSLSLACNSISKRVSAQAKDSHYTVMMDRLWFKVWMAAKQLQSHILILRLLCTWLPAVYQLQTSYYTPIINSYHLIINNIAWRSSDSDTSFPWSSWHQPDTGDLLCDGDWQIVVWVAARSAFKSQVSALLSQISMEWKDLRLPI